MNRIHYYSDNDLSITAQFNLLYVLINCSTLKGNNVNDVLELYAMHLILNTEIAKNQLMKKHMPLTSKRPLTFLGLSIVFFSNYKTIPTLKL